LEGNVARVVTEECVSHLLWGFNPAGIRSAVELKVGEAEEAIAHRRALVRVSLSKGQWT
jgi:hypothetical protein